MTLANFVTFWLCSIIFSGIGELVCTCAVIKDLADNGYLFNMDKKDNINRFIDQNELFKQRMMLLVPGYNIMNEFYKLFLVKNNSGILITQFNVMGLLKEMTKEQEQEYDKNPTGINAYKILIDDIMESIKKKVVPTPVKHTEEEIEKFRKTKEMLEELKVNTPTTINLNDIKINCTIVEENGVKKIKYDEYSGDITTLTDEALKGILLFSVLDKESTFAYFNKLKKDREEAIKTKNGTQSIKQKYINLRNEVLSKKESLNEKKLTRQK